jgi:CHAT domain-containing protein
VEDALEGAEELLIVPHKELFEVPWAALTDPDGGYLIERHVIRTTPSLRVARQAADKMQTSGHVVLVGNPLPIPKRFLSLNFADKEVESIYKILNRAGLDVHKEHHFRKDLKPFATKANVKKSLEGAALAHMALHGDLETDSLVLSIPRGSVDQDKDSGLSMQEVQGSEQEQVQGVKMAPGATVVLSACNTGRGEIKAEGVVGIARGFMLANASATVVSLWSVDDGSTAALMCIKYQHLTQTQGCTVPQALRLAMLRLARRPVRVYQVLHLFLSIHSFLLPSPSPSHTSHHSLSVSSFTFLENCQVLIHTPTTFRQTQWCKTAVKSNTNPFLQRMLRTG